MRYFKAFYIVPSDDEVDTRSPQAIHAPFDDKVFALPYRRSGWGEEPRESFAVALIAKDGAMTKTTAQGYLTRAMALWNLGSLEQTRLEEATVEDCFMDSYSRQFCNCCFDEDNIRRQLNLSSTYSFISMGRHGVKELLVERGLTPVKANELAESTRYANNLKGELERIYASGKRVASAASDAAEGEPAAYAPITYLVENNTPSDVEEAVRIVVGAMMESGRIGSGHLFVLDVDSYVRWPNRDSDNSFRTYVNHQLIRAIEGNSLVVRYGMFEGPGSYDLDAYNLLTRILDLVDGAACNTQLFLSVPEGKPDLVLRLRKRYNKPMVILSPDAGTSLDAGTFEHHLDRLERMAAGRGVEPDGSLRVLLSKRMRESRAKGRAPELEDVFDEWLTYHQARVAFPQYAAAIDDAINLNGSDLEVTAQARLDSLIGLEPVKEHIRNIILRVQMNQRLMESGLPQNPFSMHMAFLGAPGTGKTEVARLYAEILKDEGVLGEGRLITVSGGSGFKVDEAFGMAKGSVLFIDEAYGMCKFPGMITELIAQMENNRADTVVILAGYEGHMEALLSCNPGFRSRIGSPSSSRITPAKSCGGSSSSCARSSR